MMSAAGHPEVAVPSRRGLQLESADMEQGEAESDECKVNRPG
jgi:hypothetical protein